MTTVNEWIEVLKRMGGLVKATGRLLMRIHHDLWAPYDGSNGSALKWAALIWITFNIALTSFAQTWYLPTGAERKALLISKVEAIMDGVPGDKKIKVSSTPVFADVNVDIISNQPFQEVEAKINDNFLKTGWYLVSAMKDANNPQKLERNIYYSKKIYHGSRFQGELIYMDKGHIKISFEEYNEVMDRIKMLDYQRWK